MIALILLALGLALVVAGVACIFWPAALVVAGAGIAWAALVIDFDNLRGSRT